MMILNTGTYVVKLNERKASPNTSPNIITITTTKLRQNAIRRFPKTKTNKPEILSTSLPGSLRMTQLHNDSAPWHPHTTQNCNCMSVLSQLLCLSLQKFPLSLLQAQSTFEFHNWAHLKFNKEKCNKHVSLPTE